MKAKENRAVLSLGAIMASRMLGLFMILPIFFTYLHKIHKATPTLMGIALGAYGLTQALLQIPFGFLSDRYGRKAIIFLGLVLFVIGSIVAALSQGIAGIIIGRALQGAGAIGSTVLALVADFTRDEQRSQAMAFMGLTIGFAFSLAMILGPLINAHYQLTGIFWFTAGFGVISIILLYALVPSAPQVMVDDTAEPLLKRFRSVLKHKALNELHISIAIQHAILTAVFIAIPLVLTQDLRLSATTQTSLYLIILVSAFVLMLPLIIVAEKKRKMNSILIGCVVAILISQGLFYAFQRHIVLMALSLLIFFTAFTVLEASLPSLVSKISPIRDKGGAMGVYSSCQFLGIFIGASLGGFMLSHWGLAGLFLLTALLALIWMVIARQMTPIPYFSTVILPCSFDDFSQIDLPSLKKQPGVKEVLWMRSEHLLYLKIDKQQTNEARLRGFLKPGSLSSFGHTGERGNG